MIFATLAQVRITFQLENVFASLRLGIDQCRSTQTWSCETGPGVREGWTIQMRC